MTDLANLLDAEPVVAAAGIDLLAEALETQGVRVARADWRPPERGAAGALAELAATGRTVAANEQAVARMLAVRPQLVDVVPAGDVIPALVEGTFLHAGPPIAWGDCSGPLRWALIGGPAPATGALLASSIAVVVLLVGGAIYFRRMERVFADWV